MCSEALALTGQDIVVFSYADWFASWSTPQQLMSRLARHNRVLYVDQPRSLLYGLRPAHQKGEGVWSGPRVQEVQPNLHVYHLPHRFLPVGRIPLPIAKQTLHWNGRRIARMVSRQARRLGFRNPILWNFSILHGCAVDYMDATLRIYDIADVWEKYLDNEPGRRVTRWIDARMTERADVVFPSTDAIWDSHQYLNRNQHIIPHGADYDHFSRAMNPDTAVPEDISKLPSPRVGCVGVMDAPRFDTELIAQLSASLPDWSIVLVGPVLDGLDTTRFAHRSNVYLTGNRPIAELPNYLKALDVTLIPYKINDLTRSIFPLKLMEYLSAGRPVVSSAMDSVLPFREVVAIARDPEEFAAKIRMAYREDTAVARAERQAVARQYSWDEVVRRKAEVVAATLRDATSGTPVVS